jgi:DNA-directed RNA polymerase specialized sigma24 family protein
MGGSLKAFLTTQWSLIEDIKAGHDRDSVLINFLLQQYWKPVYCYVRRKGYGNEQAKDLTQDFFLEIVLNRNLVGRAEKARGRFRTFLLHALNEFLKKQRLKEASQKRTPRGKIISLDLAEAPVLPESMVTASAEDSYHYAWLSALLERVLVQVKAECERQGMGTHWALFQERVVEPTFGNQSPPTLGQLCESYHVEDVKKASNMIVTVKRRFRAVLLQHVRNTVLAQGQASDELEELLQFLPKSAQHFQ